MHTDSGKKQAAVATTRTCPSLAGDQWALITHQVDPSMCMERQRTLYHKCHRCAYRGKPASHVEASETERVMSDPAARP